MKQTDVLIVGAGPAGMMSAIYAKRANKSVVLLDKTTPGGRLHSTYQVDNYLGFGKVSAQELVQKMVDHLRDLEIEESYGFVKRITRQEEDFVIETETDKFISKTVIIASGTNPKPLNVKNEKELLSKGISYCAVCDGIFFENQDVVVVGGGDSALEESLFLSQLCKSVTIIHDLDELTATKGLVKRVTENPKIKICTKTKVLEFIGDKELSAIKVLTSNEQVETWPTQGVFIYVGNQSDTSYLKDIMTIDETGYIKVNQFMETQTKGIFACGDVTKKDFRFIVTAISDGAIAALSAVKYIDEL